MVLLVGTACVQIDSEVRLNSDGLIEEMRGGVVLRDASILSLLTVPEEHIEEYAYLWALTTGFGGFSRDQVAGVEAFIDLQPIREAGLDLEEEGFWDEVVTFIQDHGKDPETGYVYIDYLLEFPELPEDEFGEMDDLAAELAALNDPVLFSLFGGQMPSPFEYYLVTRMPGKVVSASHGQTLPGQPDVHFARVNLLTLLGGPQVVRVVADPEQRVLPYERLDIQPHHAMQKDVWQAGRYWLTDQVAVQDVTFRAGDQFHEVAGQLFNSGEQSYQWVSLGLSLFDIEGRFIDHHSLMIQNVAAGEERGFRKQLFHGDLSNVAFYRLEWAMGF